MILVDRRWQTINTLPLKNSGAALTIVSYGGIVPLELSICVDYVRVFSIWLQPGGEEFPLIGGQKKAMLGLCFQRGNLAEHLVGREASLHFCALVDLIIPFVPHLP